MTDPSMSAAEPPPAEDRGGAGTDLCQFVIFHCAEERFAAPLAQVKEIIRVPDMVRMPLSPAALLGLANLRGTVMPVLDLRHLSGLPAVLADEASRVVVLDHGHPVGLMVDRVANVVSVERGRLEAVDQLRAAVDGALLTGVIKDEAGGVVMVLDVATAVGRTFAAIAAGERDQTLHGDDHRDDVALAADDAVVDEDQLVSLEVDAQEYAFPIAEV
ncbi:chemotaxis protein CheW [Sphingomonas sp. BK345]|uniref:chemotaxis protein CheW n=1 Tax=Sphingomonas sp. BK345 TaxID=2586980 RepID=UPI0017B8295A|nr:chemotaxis protein CheW [Sphingomonas sp. BK345]MBB3471918.1 chemotaxis signal transduction protein [Sphingomonas sp. BK345]